MPIDKNTSRLRWSCRRGMRELDFLFLGYLDNAYNDAPQQERDTFEQLLNYPDQDLFDWMMGNTQPINKQLLGMVKRILDLATCSNAPR